MAKILVVDDERDIVRLVEVNLQRAGYEVVTAGDGQEALDQVEKSVPDLIVSDDAMPGIDGYGLLRALRANPQWQPIPFIMLAARAQDADIFHGWSVGVDAYITKPFKPEELLGFVAKILAAIH